ncbi:MAG TPA: ATP-binding cassette domain-containing protein [Baekduia sp.]|uniref:ABC transporter ATP-binding protein n=1 Tax=Baekduia sp. TaxID=2600305 RepID=UPI002D793FA8|nr:ATP-binding cassette domain-containing protein [Baekduia sp.]HET6507841.1 ATP-binding cassette domain-containing protein [Baekduia sp.]
MSQPDDAPILAVQDVSRRYSVRGGVRQALRGVTFTLAANATIAIVGESGAGKSTLTRLIAGFERPSTGAVLVDGAPAAVAPGKVAPVQMVFQHPAEALNRFASVGASIGEPLLRAPISRPERQARVEELLGMVGIDPARARDRPRAFSGGQLQRIVLARALAAEPRLLVCDEPTSALDVSVQAQIVNLLLELQEAKRFACVLVTHDLAVARVLADEVLVLRDGAVAEHTPADAFFEEPRSAYGHDLLRTTAAQTLNAPLRAAERVK